MRMRIVTNRYGGYNIQVWRWWWPFWVLKDYSHYKKIEDIKEDIAYYRELSAFKPKVVEYL